MNKIKQKKQLKIFPVQLLDILGQAQSPLLKEVSQKNVLFVMHQRRLGAKTIFEFPMLHIVSHFCVFPRNFQCFLTLRKQQLLHLFFGFLLDKNPP